MMRETVISGSRLAQLRLELAAIVEDPNFGHHADTVRGPLLARFAKLRREIAEAEREAVAGFSAKYARGRETRGAS